MPTHLSPNRLMSTTHTAAEATHLEHCATCSALRESLRAYCTATGRDLGATMVPSEPQAPLGLADEGTPL